MQVGEAGFTVDVMGVAAGGRDAGVDRLPALSDHDEVVDRSLAQGPENTGPGLRQGTIGAPERCRDRCPRACSRSIEVTARDRLRAILCSEPLIPPGAAALCHSWIPATGAE